MGELGELGDRRRGKKGNLYYNIDRYIDTLIQSHTDTV
jgi:hypothetical protein